MLSEWLRASSCCLTTGVSRRGLSRAGRFAPCARSASSTAFPLKWHAATPYTPAQRNTASAHPGTTGCSPLCGPGPELHHTHTYEWKSVGLQSVTFSYTCLGLIKDLVYWHKMAATHTACTTLDHNWGPTLTGEKKKKTYFWSYHFHLKMNKMLTLIQLLPLSMYKLLLKTTNIQNISKAYCDLLHHKIDRIWSYRPAESAAWNERPLYHWKSTNRF